MINVGTIYTQHHNILHGCEIKDLATIEYKFI